MKKQYLLLLILVSVLTSCKEKKQNIVFILVDDLGWTDLGYAGSTFHQSPNIDAFSQESIQFTNAYASASICSPTRAAIMTGKHPARLKITDWIPGFIPENEKLIGPDILNELPLEESTLAETFKAHGYKTFFAGKWHLGNTGYFPEDQGFDINIGGHHKGSPPGGYYTPYKNPKLTDGPNGEYLTDRLTNESINFIDTIGENPFFLYLSYYTVHTPIQANKKHLEKFNTILETIKIKNLGFKDEGRGSTRLQQLNPEYASMVYALDDNVGKLINKLKEADLYDNTIIVFTSDNGGLSTVLKNKRQKAPTAVTPLRGGKGWLYEGGIRVPLLIKPAHYSNTTKKVIDDPVISHDLYPTLLALAKIKYDNNTKIDGIDISPLINNNKPIDREELFWHYPHYHASGWAPGSAIRQGDWKFIEFYDSNTIELYNLATDISETKDLSLKYPQKAIMLQNRLHELKKATNAKSVKSNLDYIKANASL
ncbi:sulfatase [uncultured Algibacter sp.]|uniref:sulfatase n=1 Tax=uncultured Algibacter sp. TaxID=298659 RepID=UPI003217BC66